MMGQGLAEAFLPLLLASWRVFEEAAPWVLLGFLAAGLIKAFVSEEALARHLGGGSPLTVFKAALFGAPLPLCSCGVLPAAVGLRRRGAGSGATTAFLISTPETGVDSIAVSWALLGPLMAVARPLAALVTAICAGLLANALDRPGEDRPAASLVTLSTASCSCDGRCADVRPKPGLASRLRLGLEHAFGDMLADIGPWLLLGVLLSGVIETLLPGDVLTSLPYGGILPHLAMLVAGVPLYVCATASTPIAAALILKGLSPGAALVFLLAGPATNAASLTLILRLLGKRVAAVYLLAIGVCSLGLGLGLDLFLAWSGLAVAPTPPGTIAEGSEWLGTAAAIVLLAAIIRGTRPWRALAGKRGKS
ncbi:SO_0444 family Cu/Zn efflux transporter [Desulfovibrio aminophilus]|uniref:SO_0444 family Cu/Zn efflux transporter n=1 Tax=Desulfovibrio aminophilus TaxID=81425 RepID=UPI003396F8C6